MLKIGVMPSSFRIPFKDAALRARDMGAKGLQPYVTEGELAPENLTADDRRDLLRFVRDCGLTFSALCADFGMDFSDYGNNAADSGKRRFRLWHRSAAQQRRTNVPLRSR